MGFKVNSHRKKCAGFDEVLEFYRDWEAKREFAAYEIDGVVVKVDSVPQQRAARVDRQSPALGHRFQIPGASGTDRHRKHRGAGGPHRRADAGGASEAVNVERRHGVARHSAQRRRNRAAGRRDRRHRAGGAHGRRDSESGARRKTGRRPPALSHAERLPGVRRRNCARRRRSGQPVHQHQLPGAAEGIRAAFCRARRHGYRWHGRRAGGSIGRPRHGRRASPIFTS